MSPPPVAARAAIVHDWFQGFHGAERVVEAIRADVLAPGAEVLTFHAAHELLPEALSAAIVRESRLAALPGVRQRGHDPGRWRYLLPLMPRWFRSLDLSAYELVISSSHACAAMARPPAGVPHVVYSHTPIRYAWTEADRSRASGGAALVLRAYARHLRNLDREASARPDLYVANSTAVRDRIRRFYGRDALVVAPPVEVGDFSPGPAREADLFVWISRLVPYKRPLEVAEAFRGLDARLVMVGVGPLERELRQSLPPNVELRGWLERDRLAALLGRAAGFIHLAEEDFGISMVEALAAGTPVIALRRGGALDIVRDGEDGLLLPDVRADSVRRAVSALRERRWDQAALAARAQRFSRARFAERMRDLVGGLLERGARPTSRP